MTTSSKNISLTIATYNRCDLLERLLIAISKQTLEPKFYEVLICDSHSIDATSDIISSFKERHKSIEIRYLHTKNILASKRNLGIKNARNEIIVFLDDDCIPNETFLEKYYKLFNKNIIHEGKVVYCGEVRFPKEWVESSNYYRFRDSRHFGSGNRTEIKELDFRTIVVMNMAFLKKDFIESVKEVNEEFVGYGCEDQDLGWQLQKHGYKLLMCDALITHYEMSGDIDGYAKKIFHTARDGMNTLLRVNQEAVSSLDFKFRLIEPLHPKKSKLEQKLTKIITKIIFNFYISNIISFLLKKYDGYRFFYSISLYKYVLSCAYIKGALSRTHNNKTSNEWYD